MGRLGVFVLVLVGGAACSHPAAVHAPQSPEPTPPTATTAVRRVQLAVLPAESDKFPRIAQSVTASMLGARPHGIDATQMSKVSLEVAQLAIECVDPSASCYEAVGRSLAANQLLFAQITAAGKRGQLKVSVTLFDVDGSRTRAAAEQVFGSERDATAAIAALVTKATQP